jgi:hypothetical protein
MKNTGKKAILLVGLGLGATALIMAGCHGGSTDGGSAGDDSFPGTQFDGSGSGSVDLQLETTELAIGDTETFHFLVKDTNGAGVPNIEVSCDTEAGLGLIEPSNGNELTGSKGAMSGVVGCEKFGSFAIGCRLPVRGNKRSIKHIRCTGDVPIGFDGFPGAGGGGLGGTNGNGGSSNGNLDAFITAVKLFDGASETSSIDITQDACQVPYASGESPTPITVEPFYDSSVTIEVTNNTPDHLICANYRYKLGSSTSTLINFTGLNTVLPNGGTQSLQAIFARASSGGKEIIGGATIANGVKNISITVNCTNSNGDPVALTGTASANFNNFNNCPSGSSQV